MPVTSVTAAIGGTEGGDAVLVSGSGFTGATGCTFGGVPATDFFLLGDTDAIMLTPSHAAGVVDVTMDVGGTLVGGFTYAVSATHSLTGIFGIDNHFGLSVFAAIAAAWGSNWNGNTGTAAVPDQSGLPKIMIGISNFLQDDGVIPMGAQILRLYLSANYAVTMDSGNSWTFRLVGFSSGSVSGITGNVTGLLQADPATAPIGGAVWSDYSDGNEVVSGTGMGWDLLLVSDDGGTNNFQIIITNFKLNVVYIPTEPPAPIVVESVTPNRGAHTGGTAVTIRGSGFTGSSQALFGGVPATNFSVVNDTTITCDTPVPTAERNYVEVTVE